MRVCTSEPASPHVDIARESREYVAEKEPRSSFSSLDCVGEVFSCMVYCILQIEAGARANDDNVG